METKEECNYESRRVIRKEGINEKKEKTEARKEGRRRKTIGGKNEQRCFKRTQKISML